MHKLGGSLLILCQVRKSEIRLDLIECYCYGVAVGVDGARVRRVACNHRDHKQFIWPEVASKWTIGAGIQTVGHEILSIFLEAY